MQLVFELPVCR